MNWETAFRHWADLNHFRPYTTEQTLSSTRAAMRAMRDGQALPAWTRSGCRRVLLFSEEQQPVALEELRAWLQAQGVTPIETTPLPKHTRKLEARSFSEEDWLKLQDSVSSSDQPEDIVIYAMCVAGLRVGDALRIRRYELERGLETGVLELERKGGIVLPLPLGYREPWEKLFAEFRRTRAATVAGLLSSKNDSPMPGQAAYKRMDRRLKSLAEALELKGRVHTHKLRRTVAVRAIRATGGNVQMVQKLLGHSSPNTTQGYVDEHREAEVAALQRHMVERQP